MGLLKAQFANAVKKGGLGTSNTFMPYYRTGIDIFDYINGVRTADGRLELGIQGGKITQDVGNSGTGKTSKVIGQACYIADQFEDAMVIHYDFERSTSMERVMAISGWSREHYEEKYTLMNQNISVETLYKTCKELEKIKLENKEELQVASDAIDGNGNPIMVLPPTVIIVDSVALLAPAETENDDDLKGSMGASAIAKANTNVFKRILSPIENANIIIMLVNHLTEKIEIGPIKSKAQVNFLGQNETIPGEQLLPELYGDI